MTRRPLADHQAAVAAHLAGLAGTETVPVRVALDRTTSAPVRAPYSLPLFDNSAMDGFAVRAAEVSPGADLEVGGRIFAGDTTRPVLRAGTAMAIMTGAPLPAGADAVIPVEASHETAGSGQQSTVRFDAAPEPGAFIRSAGDDVAAGEVVIAAGTRLAPRHLGALAAAGVETIEVHRRPAVAIISTGSELIRAGATPQAGQVFESNSLVLQSLSTKHGARVTFIGSAGDDGDFATILTAACQDADLVLTSGGISMGEREPVRQTLAEHGWFGPVAMQPGGPQGLATWKQTPVCCLPGNPVSIVVSFEVLLRDVLRGIAGLPPVASNRAVLAHDITSVPGKTQFLRGVSEPDGSVRPLGGPGSHLAVTAAAAELLIEIDADTTELPAGTEVTTWPLT
ncbi:molybdopterin biosynthesis protein MoeA [Gordonia hirsuta DSM 44140 = NBRC 16056]|uniref:Molybdopterin molybdenumtransferase n=1 Tax=Gordonia hirsuta DSM 44140 = NBRC 16056 TaxID=1121927 RepID=L7LA23_9ACTN|nr:gephyrin-like molybdotransferase Glp [Gordonia hirsuta]GAC57591.1 molybdopterin biosynthesis protein MoeA [Gordonia hirsuta DSM 44140 = NBRC 16056]